MEPELESIIREFISGHDQAEAPGRIARGIQDGHADLLALVEALGLYLTSSVVDNRSQATLLLSSVLRLLHAHDLTPDEVHYLVSFLCDRLRDRVVVLPHALMGLHALATRHPLAGGDVVSVARALFKEVHVQSQQQSDRRLVYNILASFLATNLTAVQQLGSEFVLGFIQAMDEEKDPRNLTLIFDSLPTIIHNLPIDVLAEDLFEVISCYFPIDFTPTPGDPEAVLPEQLVLSLRRCLTATPAFAEFCLPLLLEKLSSDIVPAKVDSLLTLAMGMEVYGPDKLRPFVQPIWLALKREVFQCASHEAEEAGLQATTSLVRAVASPLSRGLGGEEGDLEQLLKSAVKDCIRHLSEPGLRLMRPASHLMLALARGSDQACALVSSAVVPLLLSQISCQTQVMLRTALMEELGEFVKLSRFHPSGVKESIESSLSALLAVLFPALGDCHASLRTVAMGTLGGLLEVEGALGTSEVCRFAEHLQRMAAADIDPGVREAALCTLTQLGRLHPQVVAESLLPPLLQTIAAGTAERAGELKAALHLLPALSSHPHTLSLSLPPLLNALFRLALPTDVGVSNSTVPMATAAGHCLRALVEQREGALPLESVVRLFALCVRGVGMGGEGEAACEAVLDDVAAVVRFHCRQVEEGAALIEILLGLFLRGETESLGLSASIDPPLNPSSEGWRLTGLLTAAIGALRPEMVRPMAPKLLPSLLTCTLHSPHPPAVTSTAKAYACIINKMQDGAELSEVLDRDTSAVWETVCDGGREKAERETALTWWLWVTRGLVVRSHPHGQSAGLKLLQLCGDDLLGPNAGDGFSLVLSEEADVLTQQCHATVRLMHKQWFFAAMIPRVVQLFSSAADAERGCLLQAMGHLLLSVPQQVLLGELQTLLPLLLASLSLPRPPLQLTALKSVCSLLEEAPHALTDHLSSLLPLLLRLTHQPDAMRVRATALRCVALLSTLPYHTIHPYRGTVTAELALCLDDHKRLVRREAVDARSKWFLLGS